MQKVPQRPTSALVNSAGRACAAALSLIHVTDDRCAIDVTATQQRRQKAVCADSESQILATKKFSLSRRWRRVGARQNRTSGRIALRRFGLTLSVAMVNLGSRRTIDARLRAALVASSTTLSRPVTGRLRCRASLSGDRSRPADWLCRRTASSPGQRTSRRVAALLSPARPCPDWPR
jgi:hypothetical protein